MTTLPRITPRGTPVPQTPITRSYSASYLYGPHPPPHLTSTFDVIKMPERINPLAPPPPRKRINSSWETTNQHLHNDRRRKFMQTREYQRYHSAWSTAFYGTPAAQEAYRKYFREVLKQQMADQDANKRQELKDKVQESEAAVEYDRQCRRQDSETFIKKYSYLTNFRDCNKMLMEDNWRFTKSQRRLENKIDREALRYNPINWSCTLK